jgi:hypothetical protein
MGLVAGDPLAMSELLANLGVQSPYIATPNTLPLTRTR